MSENAKKAAARIAAAARHHGEYVVLEETPEGNLKLTLTEDGRREAEDVRTMPEKDALTVLLECV